MVASPDRWIAGVHVAALRFVVWEPGQVRSGWLGGALTIAHAASRSVVSLPGLALDEGVWSTWSAGPSALHQVIGAPASALIRVCALRYGDMVTAHVSAGHVTRLISCASSPGGSARTRKPHPARLSAGDRRGRDTTTMEELG